MKSLVRKPEGEQGESMSAKLSLVPESANDSWEISLIKWIVCKVIIPLVVILIIWPIYYYALQLGHPFEEAFGHADLLIFSALILTEAVIEGERTLMQDWRFQLARHTGLILAFVALILFVVVKFDVMRTENSPNPDKLYFYSCIGWFMALLSAIISIYSFSKTAYQRANQGLSKLAQETSE